MTIQRDQKTLSPQSWAELGLLGLIWGATFLSVRVTLDELPVLTTVLHRTFWAALALWLWVFLRGGRFPKGRRVWAAFLVMGLLNNVIAFGLMAWGQLTIESGLTSILNATTAIFGVIVAALVFADEKLKFAKVLGVTLGLIGVVIAVGPDALRGFDPRALAQLAVLGGTLSYAFAGAWARLRLSDLDPAVAAAGMLTASTFCIAPAALWVDGIPDVTLTGRTWAAIAYLSLAGTAGAYLLYYRILAMAGAGNLLIVTLIIPPVAIVLGALVLGETLQPQAFLGFGLLAAGLLVLNGRLPRTRRKTQIG